MNRARPTFHAYGTDARQPLASTALTVSENAPISRGVPESSAPLRDTPAGIRPERLNVVGLTPLVTTNGCLYATFRNAAGSTAGVSVNAGHPMLVVSVAALFAVTGSAVDAVTVTVFANPLP